MLDLVDQLSVLLSERGWKVVTAESCTGGFVSAAITKRPGSSSILERGFVTYSNESKIELLGVNGATIATHGAVSAQTAEEMARGALKNSRGDLAISITGIAGPDGGSPEKPVGLVYFGHALKSGKTSHSKEIFKGSREDIRAAAAKKALQIIKEMAQ
ncbi:MAG: CinA family protein [Alphaproteobacteria bacterium]